MNEQLLRNESFPNSNGKLAAEWQQRCQGQTSLPELRAFLAEYPTATTDDICGVLLVDQQLQWSDGPGPRAEEYIQIFPLLEQHPRQMVDLVYGEARARARLGYQLDRDQFEDRFPEIAGQLAMQFELAEWLDETPIQTEEALPRNQQGESQLGMSAEFGDYELLLPIARGGMGVVFKARHKVLGRIVALKMIPPQQLATREEFQRFKNEVTAVSQLDHAHIVSIFEVGERDGVPYFTSRFVESGSLADQLDRFRGKPKDIAALVRNVASAVHHAHQRGVLHRDIKPSNVLIDADGRPYVTDFGLAKLLHQPSDLSHSGDLIGTPVWLAPEHAGRKPGSSTIASDIYGLGAVLYFLMTGHPPFEGTSLVDTLSQVKERDPPRPSQLAPAVNRDLEMVCLKAMDKDPARRYATAEAMADDLECFLRVAPVSARSLPWWERQRRWIRRHPVTSAVSSVLLLSVIAVSVLATYYTVNEANLNSQLTSLVRQAGVSKRDAETINDAATVIRDELARARNDHQQLLYAAHVKHAAEAFRVGDVRRADDMLNRNLPEDGSADLRGFEWYWLRRQLDVPVVEAAVVMDNPRCLSYSTDGRCLAVGDSSGRVSVFDSATKRQLQSWSTPHQMVQSVSFAPGSTMLATAGDDGAVWTWVLETSAPKNHYRLPGKGSSRVEFLSDSHLVASNASATIFLIELERDTIEKVPSELGEVYAVAATTPHKRFAAIGEAGVGIWKFGSPQRKHFIALDKTPSTQSIRFSQSGEELAFRSGYREVQAWSLVGDQPPRVIATRQILDEPWGVAFSPSGNRLAVCDRIGVLHVWPLADPHLDTNELPVDQERWQAHEGRANGIAFAPLRNELASVGRDGHLRFWKLNPVDCARMISTQTFLHGHLADLAFFSKSDVLVAGSERGIQLWNVENEVIRQTIGAEGTRRDLVATSADGRYLAAGNDEAQFVEVWELPLSGDRPVWRMDLQRCDQLVFSPDNRYLAVVDWTNDQVAIHDAINGLQKNVLSAQQCYAAAFSPDSSHLAVTVLDDIYVWNCLTWKLVHQLKGHRSTTTTVAYSPDGRWIASGSKDRAIRLWNATTGQETYRLLAHTDVVEEVRFSPDGKSLISASADGKVKVWHVATGEVLCDLYVNQENYPVHLAFSPTGHRLAVRLYHGQILLLDTSRDSQKPTSRRLSAQGT